MANGRPGRRQAKGPPWCHRPKGSRHWHYEFRLGGHRYRGTCGTDRPEVAELVVIGLRTRILRGDGDAPKAETITIDAAFGRYLLEHAQHQTDYADAVRDAKDIAAALGKATCLHEITDDVLAVAVARWRGEKDRRYANRKAAPRVSPRTVNARLVRLRAVVNMAGAKWQRQVPTIDWNLHRVKEPPARARYLSPQEVDRILAHAAAHLKPGIVFALYTGIRLDNCIGLDWSQVDLGRREVTVRQKGDRVHVVPLIEPVFVMLANLGPRERGPVFTWKPCPTAPARPLKSWRKAWRRAQERAGVDPVRWHDLRHTCASWMLWKGVGLKAVGDVLGHASIATTMRYAHLETDSKRKSLDAIWGGEPLPTGSRAEANDLRRAGPARKAEARARDRASGR